MGKIGEGHQGICVTDTWTKPKESRIEDGRWGWLRWGMVRGKIEATVLEQKFLKSEKK